VNYICTRQDADARGEHLYLFSVKRISNVHSRSQESDLKTKRADMSRYREEVLAELTDDILAFWLRNVIDLDSGGFHGSVSGRGIAEPTADKGVILATRILWTFSRAYTRVGNEEYLRAAGLMYRYLRDHFLDKEHGGVFWLVDHQGRPLDRTKKFYGQAFAI
jgi:mannobiose 2-epimerase